MALEAVRICNKCNKLKPLSEFNKRKNGKFGHQSKCKICLNEYARNQREEKPEQYKKYELARKQKSERQLWVKNYSKKYYWENRDRMLVKAKQWFVEHPDKAEESLKRLNIWLKNHPEKPKEIARKFYQDNIEQLQIEHKKYRQMYPEKNRGYVSRYRAKRNKAFIINFNEKELGQRLSMFGYKCWICGKTYQAIDHVKPLSKNGLHVLSNLRPICKSCNSKKGNKWPFLKEMINKKMAA